MSSPASEGTNHARRWVRVEFEGPNNTLAVCHLHEGQRVRVELEPEPAAAAGAKPLNHTAPSTDEELARTAKATVRYIGPVAAARDPTAVMVGIEWDEAVRGRNDGSVGGKRYFKCAHVAEGVKAGSFIQPSRIRTGEAQSLLRAVERKYETRFKADATANLYLVAEYNKAKESLHKKSLAPSGGGGGTDPLAPKVMSGSLAPDGSARHIPVLFQGEEYMQNKIAAQLANLRDMTLTQGHVAAAVEPGIPGNDEEPQPPPSEEQQLDTLTRKIPLCATLDLTDNLVRDWNELGRMVSALPALTLIAVSGNNMLYDTLFEQQQQAGGAQAAPTPLPALRPSLMQSFVRLEVLVLNGVPDAWESVVALARGQALPKLQELHLCKNNLTALSPALRGKGASSAAAAASVATAGDASALSSELAALFPSLHTLELSFNSLRDWSEIQLLDRLPRLRKLLLNNNALTSVEYAAASAPVSASSVPASPAPAPFAHLTSLGLNHNALSSFESVTALSRFPTLKELRLQGNLGLEQLTMGFNSAGAAEGAAGSDPFQAAIQLLLHAVSVDGAHNLVSSFGDADMAADARKSAAASAASAAAAAAPSSSAAAASSASAPFASTRESAALLRFQLIARLPHIVSLNRSVLSSRERSDAEKYYVLTSCQAFNRLTEEQRASAAAKAQATGVGGSAMDALFPRYSELVALHGDPAPTMTALQKQLIEPSGSTLASKLVEVTLLLAEPEGMAPPESVPAPPSTIPLPAVPGLTVRAAASKKVSSSLTVQAVRQLLDKTFKLPAHRKAAYGLQWRESAADAAAHPLDEPLKSLSYFGVGNGAFIVLLRNK